MSRSLWLVTNDLRLGDNPVLQAAARGQRLVPVWLEPAEFGQLGEHRKKYLLASLDGLARALAARGSGLLRASSLEQLAGFIRQHAITELHAAWSPAPQQQAAFENIHQITGLAVQTQQAGTLFDSAAQPVLAAAERGFHRFREQAERWPVPLPMAEPSSLPPLPAGAEPSIFSSESELAFPAGEADQLAELARYCSVEGGLFSYKVTRNGLLGRYSSRMSPGLSAGALSPRAAWSLITQAELSNGANESSYWLKFELLWREYFQWHVAQHGSAIFANPAAADPLPEPVLRWQAGATGCRIVDAGMRELAATGWLGNRARQIVASYLVHDLNQPYGYGAAYFDRLLIDADPAANWGNWHAISQKPGMDIAWQASQYDPAGEYAAHWLGA